MEQRIKIEKIRFTSEEVDMYDLSVEDNENFILSNGIISHNSSKMIACETQKPFVYITGSLGRRKIIEMLTHLKPNALILIDEIHNLSERVSEIIYPAIEYNELYLNGNRCCFYWNYNRTRKIT